MSFGLNGDRMNRATLSAIRRPRALQQTQYANSGMSNDNAQSPLASLSSSTAGATANFNQNTMNSNEFLFGPDDRSIDDKNSHHHNSAVQNNTFFLPKEPFKLLESLEISVNNGNLDPQLIYDVCNHLKVNGCYLDESPFKDQLDLYFNTLRNITRDNRLDSLSRSRLLELIELRAMNWISSEELSSFYQRKLSELESLASAFNLNTNLSSLDLTLSPSLTSASFRANSPTTNLPSLSSAEFIRPSGKYTKPSKVPGKSFVKDEFVIRNSDSGKVMGIKGRRVHLIEELSDTVISFQRVNPGAKERLLQITGPTDDSISRAKCYIEDTIKRNASPVPFDQPASSSTPFPSASFSSGLHAPVCSNANALSRSSSSTDNANFSVSSGPGGGVGSLPHVQTVYVASDVVVVSSNSSCLVDQAKVVLDQYFNSNTSRARDSIGSVFEGRKSIGGYEASESSDSEIYVSHPSRCDGQRNANLHSTPTYNKPVGTPSSSMLQQQHQVKQSSSGYSLARQSSFHTVLTSTGASTSAFKPLSTADVDPERGALWRSASQGSFLPPGRSSLRYLNIDFELEKKQEQLEETNECELLVSVQQQEVTDEEEKQKLSYEREFLMNCSKSPASRGHPPGYDRMKSVMPDIVKEDPVD